MLDLGIRRDVAAATTAAPALAQDEITVTATSPWSRRGGATFRNRTMIFAIRRFDRRPLALHAAPGLDDSLNDAATRTSEWTSMAVIASTSAASLRRRRIYYAYRRRRLDSTSVRQDVENSPRHASGSLTTTRNRNVIRDAAGDSGSRRKFPRAATALHDGFGETTLGTPWFVGGAASRSARLQKTTSQPRREPRVLDRSARCRLPSRGKTEINVRTLTVGQNWEAAAATSGLRVLLCGDLRDGGKMSKG